MRTPFTERQAEMKAKETVGAIYAATQIEMDNVLAVAKDTRRRVKRYGLQLKRVQAR